MIYSGYWEYDREKETLKKAEKRNTGISLINFLLQLHYCS